MLGLIFNIFYCVGYIITHGNEIYIMHKGLYYIIKNIKMIKMDSYIIKRYYNMVVYNNYIK